MQNTSSHGSKNRPRWVIVTSALGFLLVLGLLIAEGLYRVWNTHWRGVGTTFAPTTLWEYHPRYGAVHKPNSELAQGYTDNGRLIHCGGLIHKTNRDGFAGRTDLAAFRAAARRVVLTGDSQSAWYRDGDTIPDIIEKTLNGSGAPPTALINRAHAAYGLLHMLRVASDSMTELNPDLVVILFISDDLQRPFWWQENRVQGSHERELIWSRADKRDARDRRIIEPRATDAWCQSQTIGSSPELIGQMTERARQYQQEYIRRSPEYAFWRIQIIDKLMIRVKGFLQSERRANRGMVLRAAPSDEILSHPIFAEASATLKTHKGRLALVHLPAAEELREGHAFLTEDAKRIWNALEEQTGVKVTTVFDLRASMPREPLDLLPHDNHVNRLGVEFFGKGIGQVLSRHTALKRP